jgi:sigma-B regulation protein RsbU (phosphoserine phosphatase)
MMKASATRILLGADHPSAIEDLRVLLVEAGYQVDWQALDGAPTEDLVSFQLIILEGSQPAEAGLRRCHRIRAHLGDRFIPILYVLRDVTTAARQACFEGGADACLLRPFAPGEMLAQIQAFLRIKDAHDRLTEKTGEINRINRRLQQAYQQIDQELELARRIQLSFLPQELPEVPRLRFAVHYMLCGRVGGDFYDVFRLDENHVGFYVADAMGHGVPASLLTIFVKKGVRAKEVFGQQYRLVPPSEVLERLNRDLIDQALSDNPFITMIYGLFNHKEGTLSFARAGHPYPLYVPRHGDPCLWQQEGSLLGVFDTHYPVQKREVRPGDKVLLYTDGMDGAQFGGRSPGTDSMLECAARHRALPIREFVDRLPRDLFGQTSQTDDLTLLGMEECG